MDGSGRVLLLNELKKNRLRNSKLIEDLKREVEDLRATTTTRAKSYHHPSDSRYNRHPPQVGMGSIPNLPFRGISQMPLDSTVPLLLPYESNSVASEANLLKMQYMASGGGDPTIVAQLDQLVAQAVSAHQFNDPMANAQMTGRAAGRDPLTLKILEDYRHENEKLRNELETVKHGKVTEEDELSVLRRDHILKMTQMRQEVEQLQQMAKIQQMKQQLDPNSNSSDNTMGEKLKHWERRVGSRETPYLLAHASYPLGDSLNLAPYDPASGFLLFHDYVLNVDPSYKSLKVVARLFRGGLELGSAVPLPERQCVGMHGDSYSSSYLHCLAKAIIPVKAIFYPRVAQICVQDCETLFPQNAEDLSEAAASLCLPSPDLSLLVEVQASSHYDERLKTVCWAKFLLFDDQHRVLSGRWKVPLRVIPVRPDLHPRDTNNIPQVTVLISRRKSLATKIKLRSRKSGQRSV
ncbi:coiled-coil domain-containing protein 17-like [Symsagittifera roscoffensis]|uniref:coiled-coil domain-containing protein 17-like n=1 Tax=Symsagittifera roscoffensis TaxID=84072 RepID=UPI00307B9C14